MGMSKGFAPSQPAEKSEELNKPKPISIEDLQTGFSNYFDDVPDPRVERTKQHLYQFTMKLHLIELQGYSPNHREIKLRKDSGI